jgi:two-component system cell cycle response regulator DivK
MSKRILVVEDQPDNRQIIRDMLARWIPMRMRSGRAFATAASACSPSSASVISRQIKANPAMRSIPIIAVTSHPLDGEEQTARAAGCDGYVPEPYSPRQLLAKIQQCMPQ